MLSRSSAAAFTACSADPICVASDPSDALPLIFETAFCTALPSAWIFCS